MVLKVSRRGNVPPFIVMDVMRAAAEQEAKGADVLHLEVGQPSTGAPLGVVEAARAALGQTLGYTDALGMPAIRLAIARHYRSQYGIDLDPSRVVVTMGSSGAFLLSFLASFDAGDRVGLASPSYPAYRNILSALGIVPVELEAGAGQRYQATVDLVRGSREKLDGLIVASPANPTGSMMPAAELAALARYCEAAGIRFVSDEIYHGIVYEGAASTALASSDQAIVINSFSKYFSMTGWRLGWMVVPPDLVRSVECLAQNFFVAPPTLSQLAACAVFDCGDELDANVRSYARNRELLLDRLPRAGFRDIAPPDGAFYLYADVGHLTNDSADFCRRMLAETGVAATPGIDFDTTRGARFIRFCYAGSFDDAAAAADRLEAWLK